MRRMMMGFALSLVLFVSGCILVEKGYSFLTGRPVPTKVDPKTGEEKTDWGQLALTVAATLLGGKGAQVVHARMKDAGPGTVI